MDYFLRCYILYPWLYFVASYASYEEGSCRALTFQPSLSVTNGRLKNHTIKSFQIRSMHECEWICYQEHDCVSVNFETKAKPDGKHRCELNNSTHAEHGKDLIKAEDYIYRGTENACGKSQCKNGGTCQSGFTQKRYRCLCTPGFNGDLCHEDINECSSENECHVNATCTNTKGSYKCTCKKGFKGDGRNCSDIDECSSENNCLVNATCTNIIGSYNCTCKKGYGGDGTGCPDINECSSENECHVNATCTNTIGSYYCTCKKGYGGDGRNCSDINECSPENECHGNATCTNTIGSYNCTCREGFGGDGRNCSDINECSSENECQGNATCTNTIGSYNCTCREGYGGDGRNCSDIDECSSENNCLVNAACTNIIGSYNCTCKRGYGGDGTGRPDVNECSSENECHVNATCTNTKGSYKCTCKEGFTGDGRNCSDIDECSSENNCHVNANCTNTIGSYNCTCKKGYGGDERNCSGKDCLDIKTRGLSLGDGIYLLNPDGESPSNAFQAYCDMTSYNGGWTMCYTTDEYAKPRMEVTYNAKTPYGSDGYRTDCNNIPFTEIMFVDHQTGEKAYFKRKSNLSVKAAAQYGKNGSALGLWDAVGAATAYSYQLLICDHSFYTGFFVSGFTGNCYKHCNTWCGDVSSPYFRTASNDSIYKGVAFNANGHRLVSPRLMSVGLR